MNRLEILSLYLLTCTAALSQTDGGGPVPPPSIPEGQLIFDPPQRTSLGALGTAMSAIYVCAEDGSLFLQIAGSPQKMDFDLHSLQGATGDIRFVAPHVPGYGPIGYWVWNYFVNDDQVAMLVNTTIEQNQFEKQKGPPTWVWLALLYDRKGTFESAVPIPRELDPKAVGIYGSGDLLVIAANKITKAAELYVLSPKGDVINHFLLFDEDYNTSKMAKKNQPLSEMTPDGALTLMQLVANGSNLLLVPQTTSAPISEVNERGVVRTVQLKLPKGTAIASFLSRKESLWRVRTFTGETITTDTKTGQTTGDLQAGPVLEFNSSDGSLLRRIEQPTNLNASLACEHNGDYTALTTDPKDGRLEILKGTEAKK
jgi:hypothetical protein